MITFSTVGAVERAAPITLRMYGGGSYSPTVWFLLDPHEGDNVELGFLYQGGTFAPLNWKEVWNSQLVGEVAVNAVRVGERSFAPTARTPMDVGTSYSTGFLRCANGNLALRVETLGCYVFSITENSARIYIARARHGSYIKSKRDYEFVQIVGIWADVKRTRNAQKQYVWRMARATTTGYAPPIGGEFNTLSDLVGDWCLRVRSYWDANWTKSSFEPKGAKWISMDQTSQPASRETIIAYLRHNHRLLQQEMRVAEEREEPYLHARSFDQVQKFEGNFLVLLSKLDSFGQVTIKSFLDLAQSPGGAKDLASFWLANRYGDRLSISGVADLVKAIDKEFLTVRARTERFIRGNSRTSVPFSDGYWNANFTFGTNIAVTPRDYNALMKLIRVAYEWDFYPTLANVWDAIPLSFVVDWIGNVGDIFASVDRMVQSHYYDVAKILQSARAEASDPVVQGVQHIYYERRFEPSLLLGVESVKFGLPSFINLIDGAALLCG